MKKTRLIMGMPITVEIVGAKSFKDINDVFDYFVQVDDRYSTYKSDSEISHINGGLPREQWSTEMRHVLALCDDTKRQTHGYFDITRDDGYLDPSGLVKGWAIHNAAHLLVKRGRHNFYIEAGGDIQTHGLNESGGWWVVGIRNPFNMNEIIKVLRLRGEGIATSGTYVRGEHIYNPLKHQPVTEVSSLTVIAPNIYEADRFATAAYAMGKSGIAFIEACPGLEGYMVDDNKVATFTSGFERYVADV